MRILLSLLLSACCTLAEEHTFTNPLLPSGADPWSLHKDGWYYYTHTTGRNITLWKTRNLSGLAHAEHKVVWTPPPGKPYSKDVWAPELHFVGNRWYVYFAADDGRNRNHRLYVLENRSPDPLEGDWRLLGELKTPEDRWSIDGSIFEHGGKLYLLWSGWPADENGEQDIYICRLVKPWKTAGRRVKISAPTLPWEKVGEIAKPGPDDKPHVNVNEGPEAIRRGDRIFVVYSASGCWTDSYVLGMVWAPANSNLLDPASWHKFPDPVFQAKDVQGTYAAGHHSFFRSPSGTEDWILYHANNEPGQGCGSRRNPRMQPFTWKPDGTPDFGRPVPAGVPLPLPSQKPKQ